MWLAGGTERRIATDFAAPGRVMTSRFARAVAACSLIVLLSACNMTVQITTHLNGNGGGTLGLRMVLDKEVRDGLSGSAGGQGITVLEDLFTRLGGAGWTVTRTEPAGGLELDATKAFTNQQTFTQAMKDLSGGSTSGSGALGGYALGYTSHGSFFKTKTDFSGTVDTSAWRAILAATVTKGDQKAAQQLLDSAADNFHFEILATLPGSVSVQKGDGTVSNGEAIWRPALGSRVDISASASAINTSSLLLVGLPALLILAGLGWYAIGRRQKPLIAEAPTPAHRRRERIARAPQPVEQLLAIIPDPEPVSLEAPVIELDVPQPALDVQPAQPAEPTA
jgi:hypothetical protein